MERIKLKFFYLLIAGALLASCKNDGELVTINGGTAPQLSVSSTNDLVLSKANASFGSLQFQWTNPNYQFSNGVNTQDVSYLLQIDTSGSDFSHPTGISVNRDVTTSFTVQSLNTLLANLELADFVAHPFEFRIKATLANNSEPLYSNVIKINVTTYLDVVFPVPNNLYMTGDGTKGGWMVAGDPELLKQKFTKINAYTFELQSAEFVAGSGFLFVPVYGDWGNKYGFTGDKYGNNVAGDSFKPNGNDFLPPAAGIHKVTVNFKTGKYTVQ